MKKWKKKQKQKKKKEEKKLMAQWRLCLLDDLRSRTSVFFGGGGVISLNFTTAIWVFIFTA